MPPSKGPSDSSPPLARTSYAVVALFVVAAALCLTRFDLDRIPIQFSDEVGYMWAGFNQLDVDFLSLYSFPVHSATYALGSLFEADSIRLYQLNGVLPFFLMVFAILALSSRIHGSIALGLLVAAPLITNNGLGISAWPHPNHTAAVIFLFGILWALNRRDNRTGVFLFFVVLFFVLTFARSEFCLSLYLTLGFGGLLRLAETRQSTEPGRWSRLYVDLAFILLALVLLSLMWSKPLLLDRHRSLAAFAQHYAYGLSLEGLTDKDPWQQAFEVYHENFGETTSMSGAFFSNPGAFVAHLWRNAMAYFRLLGSLNFPSIIVILAVELAALTFAARLVMKVVSGVRTRVVPDIDPIALYTLFGLLPSYVLLVLIHPRANYYQMHFMMAGAFVLVTVRSIDRFANIMGRVQAPQVLALAALLLVGAKPLPNTKDPVASTFRHARATVSAQAAGRPWKLIATMNVCSLMNRDCVAVALDDEVVADFPAALSDPTTRLVFIREDDLPFVSEQARAALQAFAADPSAHNYTPLLSDDPKLRFFIRNP